MNIFFSYFFIFIVRLYQIFVSPFIGSNCRFYPSCSTYALQALRKYGVFPGLLKVFYRLLRCNPWGGSGHYPLK